MNKGNELTTRPDAGGALSRSDQQRSIAEVQASMLLARANPRDEKNAIQRIQNECDRPGLAQLAVYQYARGGTDISGPSIRLAEAIARHWGNLYYGLRELERREYESDVEAFCHDVEMNVRRTVVFAVPHIRETKKGSVRLKDSRDIYEHIANQGARRIRACILGVIPGDVVDDAVSRCEETLKATADTSPEGIKKILVAFAEYGVGREHIEARIQRSIESITAAQVASLKKIYASLRDGMSRPVDWFPVAEPTPATGLEAVRKMLQDRQVHAAPENPDAEPELTEDERRAILAAEREG